jgi:hypothetical protein
MLGPTIVFDGARSTLRTVDTALVILTVTLKYQNDYRFVEVGGELPAVTIFEKLKSTEDLPTSPDGAMVW